jgi:hypothetical protein
MEKVPQQCSENLFSGTYISFKFLKGKLTFLAILYKLELSVCALMVFKIFQITCTVIETINCKTFACINDD